MNTNKHTPGPWSLIALGCGEWQINAPDARGEDEWSVGMAFGAAGFHGMEGEEESNANARLIAAAPELLAQLKHAVHWHDQLTPADIARYEAAIAKAEGRALPLNAEGGDK